MPHLSPLNWLLFLLMLWSFILMLSLLSTYTNNPCTSNIYYHSSTHKQSWSWL